MVTKTANLELTEVQDQDVGPGAAASFNNSYDRLDSLVQLAVLSASTNAAPASPRQGDRYIVPVTLTGGDAWAGQPRRVAYFSSTGWLFMTPRPGWQAYAIDEDKNYIFKSTDWISSSPIVDPTTSKGDLIVRTSSGLVRLPVGADHQVLIADSTATPGVDWKALFTAKGQLLGFDGTDLVDLNVGSDGKVLTADSSAPAGWSWQTPSGGGGGAVQEPGTLPSLVYWFDAFQVVGENGVDLPVMADFTPWGAAHALADLGAAFGSSLNGHGYAVFPANANGRYTFKPGILGTFTAIGVMNMAGGGGSLFSGVGGAMALQFDSSIHLYLVKASVAVIAESTGTFSTGTWVQFSVTYDAGSGAYAFTIAGAAAGSGTSGSSIANPTTSLGWDQSSSSGDWNGSLAELAIYNRVLSGPDIAAVQAYLLAKWGV